MSYILEEYYNKEGGPSVMKKKLIMFMSMILSLICFVSCNNEKKTTFKLDVVDNSNLESVLY